MLETPVARVVTARTRRRADRDCGTSLLLCASAFVVLAACGDSGERVAPAVVGVPGARTVKTALTSTPGGPAHELYAARGFTCVSCHPCGKRSPGGHPVSWMDQASAQFHASSANQNIASCQTCHGTNLDGVGGSTVVSCAQCHGATWMTTCTMCHGGVDGTTGAPPRATWGNGGDASGLGRTPRTSRRRTALRAGRLRGVSAVPRARSRPATSAPPPRRSPSRASRRSSSPRPGRRGTARRRRARRRTATARRSPAAPPRTPRGRSPTASACACTACHGAPPPPPHPANPACGLCHAGYIGDEREPRLAHGRPTSTS